MSSVIVNSWYVFPLWTWNFNPTKLGRIVAARAWVRTGGTLSLGLTLGMGNLVERTGQSGSGSEAREFRGPGVLTGRCLGLRS
jgi:hypothetical protein